MTMCTEHVQITSLHSRMVELNTGEEHITILAVLPYRYLPTGGGTVQLIEALIIYMKQE